MERKMQDYIINSFQEILDVSWCPPDTYIKQLKKITSILGDKNLNEKKVSRLKLLETTNKKFDLNKVSIKYFIDTSAKHKVYFNFHEKNNIRDAFNSWNYDGFRDIILKLNVEGNLKEYLVTLFNPIDEVDIINFIKTQLIESDKKEKILCSLFSAFVFHSFQLRDIYNYFNNLSHNGKNYQSDYYSFLKSNFGHKFERNLGLSVIKINQNFINEFSDYIELQSNIFEFVKQQYALLSNHCYFAIKIENITWKGKNVVWDLYSDIVLYSEKFIEEKTAKGYFHPSKIQEATQNYIEGLDIESASFDLCNTGFTYKDCIVLTDKQLNGSANNRYQYSILLLFEKNERDEEVIPCPACRSMKVRGNSYPVLGVKSWECYNTFCYDKSKYNRGKRYSLASLIKQEAIDDEKSLILNGTIEKFRLDVVGNIDDDNVIEFLIRHYSLFGDNVNLYHFDDISDKLDLGRKIHHEKLVKSQVQSDNFYDIAFFHRFALVNSSKKNKEYKNLSSIANVEVYNGDSFFVLQQFQDSSIDGAVTSPPYYNARSYSQWANIYCYLYDMYNNAREVFRVLKPGSYYLYNIFDYFDNENNVVFSAMGKKRMILGSYIIYLFKKIGFQVTENVIWYKGHIQGNRSNNQGNISPYYQAPLNCYEHILCFQKPSLKQELNFPDLIKVHPVVKMIKGKNILGHTAPFPSEIPALLTNKLFKGATILDPYAGSFTTARQALKNGIKSINIEMDLNYCNLGLDLIRKESIGKSYSLF